jgi:hypothetical protein
VITTMIYAPTNGTTDLAQGMIAGAMADQMAQKATDVVAGEPGQDGSPNGSRTR